MPDHIRYQNPGSCLQIVLSYADLCIEIREEEVCRLVNMDINNTGFKMSYGGRKVNTFVWPQGKRTFTRKLSRTLVFRVCPGVSSINPTGGTTPHGNKLVSL